MASSSAPQIDYAPIVHHPSEFSSPETGLVVPVFQKGDDPIDAINHMMSFLTAVVTSRYPATNNQLRTSSNPHQQATINNGRVTIQPIQGRQNSISAGSSRPFASGSGGASRKLTGCFSSLFNLQINQTMYKCTIEIKINHRGACLSWGRWGEVVGVMGCGGEAAGKEGSGVAVGGGKSGVYSRFSNVGKRQGRV
uniref:Uncharacterized protein n=1 Tax=Tanacetum cinerariifolium TaxID=118510 RepID=A0A699IMJ5_TANCI|nr:hypothetical protein [Tanacetum cinerariifolium]